MFLFCDVKIYVKICLIFLIYEIKNICLNLSLVSVSEIKNITSSENAEHFMSKIMSEIVKMSKVFNS